MLSAAKHLLYLIESKQNRSFALLRMTWSGAFFRSPFLVLLSAKHQYHRRNEAEVDST